jgi:hypothetical protein
VWDTAQHGTANSLEQATTIAAHLAEQPSEPNPKFIQFAKYVQNHFKTAEGSEKSYFLDFDNEAKENKTAALMVELPNDAWQPVLMCMVDAASRLGLAIYDEDIQMAFMPPNVILPESRIDAWEQLKEDVIQPRFPQTIKQLKTWIKPLLNSLLAKNGFDTKGVEGEFDQVRYTKKTALVTQFINIQYSSKYRGEFGISVQFGASSDIVNLISKKFNLPPYRNSSSRIESHIFKLLGSHFIPSNSLRNRMDQHQEPNDIYEFLGHVESIIFPILALAQDINSLDKFINGGIINGVHDSIKDKAVKKLTFVDHRVRLIVARLANNSDFEELVLKLKPQAPKFEGYIDESKRVQATESYNAASIQWEYLVNYLRHELKPIQQSPEGFLTQLQNDLFPNSEGFPTTKEPFRELLAAKVGDLVSEYGFVQAESVENSGRFIMRYCKTINMGKLMLSVFCEDVHNDNFISQIRLNIKEDNMIAIAKKANFSADVEWDSGIVLISKPKNLYIYNWTTLNELLSIIKEIALIWLDGVDNIKGIDALLNGGKVDTAAKTDSYGYFYDFYALITARLVNNPNFEELAVSLSNYVAISGNRFGQLNDTLQKTWPKLVQYLRDEVKPLV